MGNTNSQQQEQVKKDKDYEQNMDRDLLIQKGTKRKCTDIHFCIIFSLLSLAIIFLGCYSFTQPNFGKITVPYDPDGKGCGVDNGYTDYPYIYFASPHIDSLYVTTCVKKCPLKTDTALECKTNSIVTSCNPTKGATNQASVQIYDSTSITKICFPSDTTISQSIASAVSFGLVQDLSNGWKVIGISIGVTVLVVFVFMLFLRIFAKVIVWILVFTAFLILLALGLFFFIPANQLPSSVVFLSNFQSANQTVNYIIGVLFLIGAALVLVLACCWRRKLNLASSIITVAAQFVSNSFWIFLLPISLFIAIIIFLALWLLFVVGFYSLGTPIKQKNSLPFQHFQLSNQVIGILIAHFIYLFWMICFLSQIGSFIIIGAAVEFYYKNPHPFQDSSRRFNRYHSPSVVKGAFLWMLIGWLKFIVFILTPSTEKQSGCLYWWNKCCKVLCCICVDYLFKCLDASAFTLVHLKGESYCTAAGTAIGKKLEHLAQSAVVQTTNFIFNWLGKLTISGITSLICYLLLTRVDPWVHTVTSPYFITIIVFLIALIIANFFISIYTDAVTATYCCFLVDDKQHLPPRQLQDFLEDGKQNQQ